MNWEDINPYQIMINYKDVEPRAYQLNIAKSIYAGYNTLIVLPTGLGKTLIAVLAIAKVLYENRRAMLLAPTKPLAEQHYAYVSKMLNINSRDILLLTGTTKANEREKKEFDARVIVATPQTIANDLKLGRFMMDNFAIAIFDECHKAIGKYAYTYIANECKLRHIQIVGLTASPGSNKKKITQLVEILGIEKIEARTSTDPDVRPYVMDKTTKIVYLENNDVILTIMEKLRPIINEHLGKLYSYGLSPFKSFENVPKRKLLELGKIISKIEAKNFMFMAIYNYVYVINLMHAYELISTEGLYPFVSYFDALAAREKKSKALQNILANQDIVYSIDIARKALDRGVEHPKMFMTVKIIKNELKDKSVIVFAQYRSTIKKIVEILSSNQIDAKAFVGKKEGITQASQQQVIKDFREGKFKVLVATSIGEEGLDIPSVDTVIFYEPVASEIRNIQRRGRAGRIATGHIIVLVTKRTKDEAYLMASISKERKMKEEIEKISMHMHESKKTIGQQRL
ncbi:MAG: helicase-related protein [Candidatus Micrarchaeaceae archaeon]